MRRGFTLVEILMVVVILGIASAVIVPQIGTRSDLKARAAARMVIADLIYAQNMAIATQKMHYVKFDAGNNRYTIYDDAPLDASNIINHPVNKSAYTVQFGAAGGARYADLALDSAGTVFNGISVSHRPADTICFDELGTPFVYRADQVTKTDEMLDGAVRVKSGTFTLTVQVQRYTGEISIQ
jgi:general secretion pathway protein H